jgi:hypothetical protein
LLIGGIYIHRKEDGFFRLIDETKHHMLTRQACLQTEVSLDADLYSPLYIMLVDKNI